ncbi:SRPBCC family protein [Taklimakanibacter lacteus]|uniref:SRPBCC family protein n=1 Tax=Taklimakanibacter lacteus TaxID=2268456 RepID=UPI003F6854D2
MRKTVEVKATPERAFDVFTAGMGRWWAKSHSIGSSPQQDVIIEPRVGGRWFERGTDGTECQWGHVIHWEPPHRIVLAWQLNAEWRFDANLVTELDIRFIEIGHGMIRIELEHRNLERFGDKAAEVRSALDSEGGWQGLLAAYTAVI